MIYELKIPCLHQRWKNRPQEICDTPNHRSSMPNALSPMSVVKIVVVTVIDVIHCEEECVHGTSLWWRAQCSPLGRTGCPLSVIHPLKEVRPVGLVKCGFSTCNHYKHIQLDVINFRSYGKPGISKVKNVGCSPAVTWASQPGNVERVSSKVTRLERSGITCVVCSL